jgi:hypothetical protein
MVFMSWWLTCGAKREKGSSAMEIWQNKIRFLRKYLRGWTKKMNGVHKKEKTELIEKIEQLDKKAETTMLLQHEVDMKRCLKKRLLQLLREEEIKWYQRSKSDKILMGDNNTKYVHLLANGKHRETHIFQLEDDDRIIKGDEQLEAYITQYYKRLFSPTKLTMAFTERDAKEAILQMKHNIALGPDGFSPEFYQVFREIIKGDLMALFREFHEGKLPLFNLNFGVITLLPKQKEATHIKQYRPICLLNVSFKIFTEVMVN